MRVNRTGNGSRASASLFAAVSECGLAAVRPPVRPWARELSVKSICGIDLIAPPTTTARCCGCSSCRPRSYRTRVRPRSLLCPEESRSTFTTAPPEGSVEAIARATSLVVTAGEFEKRSHVAFVVRVTPGQTTACGPHETATVPFGTPKTTYGGLPGLTW